MDGWVANRLNAKMLDRWTKLSVDPGWLNLGDNSCPVDGTKLERHTGESVPPNLVVKRCGRCGRWWFPADSLLEFKPAQEAKLNYFKLWGMTADVSALLLPVLGAAVVLTGMVAGVRLVRQRQQAAVEAASLVSGFGSTYLGEGEALAAFYSPVVMTEVEYRRVGIAEWTKIPVRKESGVYLVRLTGLAENGEYEVRVVGKEFRFSAK